MNNDAFTEIGSDPYDEIQPFSAKTIHRIKSIARALIGLVIVAAIPAAFFEGHRRGRKEAYSQITAPQREWLDEFIQQHSESYSNVSIQESGDGYLYLTGDVPTKDDRMLCVNLAEKEFGVRVSAKMTRLLGIESWY